MEEAEYMGMSVEEFEYMLRNERTFLKELLEPAKRPASRLRKDCGI